MKTIRNSKNRNKIIRIIAAIFIAAIAVIFLLLYYNRVFVPPSFVEWREIEAKEEEFGLTVSLKDKNISVCNDTGQIWTSPKRFKVSDFILCDIDYDGQKEMILLSWKRGKYGKSRPSWVKRDEIKWSQHIYIYDLSPDKVSPLWMASEIGFDVCGWNFKNGVLVLGDTQGQITKWRWDSWGISRVLE